MQHCGEYYVVDNVKNFKLRVSLRRVTRGGSETVGGNVLDEQLVVKWQEKYFSRHEENLYADYDNCLTSLQQKYHHDILQLREEGGRSNNRLYTYSNSDAVPVNISKVYQPLLNSVKDAETFVTKYGGGVVRRRRAFNTLQPLLLAPDHSDRVSTRCPTPSLQHMYIMVDLSNHLSDEIDEHVLCHLMVKDNFALTMVPDVSIDKPWYRVESANKEVYEYKIDHVSPPISDQEMHHEQQMQRKLLRERQYKCEAEFSDSIPADLRVMVLGSVISAQDFEYNNLYVIVDMQLPSDWLGSTNTTCTQICQTTPTHTAYFSCPLEYELLYCGGNHGDRASMKWPILVFQVFSYDQWERNRPEGYGYCNMPSSPGLHRMDIATWRPTASTLKDHLTRYFIGGLPTLKDTSYLSPTFSKERASRAGVNTVSSGVVSISLNIIHQSQTNIQEDARAEIVTTQTVLELLHKTRQKLKDVHQ